MTTPDLTAKGTPERTWANAGYPEALPTLDWSVLASAARVVVIAPHPDDEVLGVGGIMTRLAEQGVPMLAAAVTDGEASHPGRAEELRALRAREREAALVALDANPEVVRLGLPDSGVRTDALRPLLEDLITPEDVVLAPWERDGHPDHDACGRAVAGLGRVRLSYVVWGWHWATPADLPRERARRVTLTPAQHLRKRAAVAAYRSQLEGPDPILPPHVRVRLLRPAETLLVDA